MEKLVIIAVGLLCMCLQLTGCSASGYEIGGKLGVYAVQDREVVERTHSTKSPIACWWDEKYCNSGGVQK